MSHKLTVAQYLTLHIESCGRKQLEIANDCDFKKPNMITMIKQGKSKLPLDKLIKMADAIEVDRVELLKIVLSEYEPSWLDVISDVLGSKSLITDNEFAIITNLRSQTMNSNPSPDEIKIVAA